MSSINNMSDFISMLQVFCLCTGLSENLVGEGRNAVGKEQTQEMNVCHFSLPAGLTNEKIRDPSFQSSGSKYGHKCFETTPSEQKETTCYELLERGKLSSTIFGNGL